MANEVTQRDLQALEVKCTKMVAEVRKLFQNVPGIQSAIKMQQQHRKELDDLRRDVNAIRTDIGTIRNDVSALKTAVSRLQQS